MDRGRATHDHCGGFSHPRLIHISLHMDSTAVHLSSLAQLHVVEIVANLRQFGDESLACGKVDKTRNRLPVNDL
jgi:hypothetical protein